MLVFEIYCFMVSGCEMQKNENIPSIRPSNGACCHDDVIVSVTSPAPSLKGHYGYA